MHGDSPAVSNLWVSGTTQIDLRGTVDRAGGPVNWSTEWLLELDPRNPKALEVELDPGLELLDVVGSAVRGFRIEPRAGRRRVIVTLGGELKSATEVRFLAHARVPRDGVWPIPAIRPLNATWTGGTTTVILDREPRRGGMHRESGPATLRPERRNGRHEAACLPGVVSTVGCGARLSQAGIRIVVLDPGPLFVSGSPAAWNASSTGPPRNPCRASSKSS